MNIFKLFGDANEKTIKAMRPIIDKINSLEESISPLSDEELKNQTIKFKERLAAGENLDDILPEAFATIREASKRILGQRHFDVQLIGGLVLHRGQIAEMKTGEGKTLVATLPLYLNALSGRGVHLVTVNDYLSRVGAGWMAPVYHSLGLSTGIVVHEFAYAYDPDYIDESQYDERLRHFRKVPRREAYLCDITYGTNNEFGFDYLRDNMVYELKQAVQRPLNFAIVDEIDSILIDEARTPLIISASAEESTDKYFKYARLVETLVENDDYNIDEKMKAATLTETGISRVEKILGLGNIYVEGGVREVHHLEQALKAMALFKRDRDYVVKDGEIIIVDEFTGRLMPGRRYSEGLHQAIEAKENVKVQKESRTMATITFQNLFRLYTKLAGMTGTAATEAEEFHKIYNLDTIVIPTNRPNIRQDYNDLIYRTEADKFQAVIKDVKERNAKGQPVLIGTISIEKNEVLAEMMEREGLRPQILNAKNHQKEAEIISQAGKRSAVTLATNMAGRGVDILLGGSPSETREQEEVRALGGLHVIGTERHESRRIDNQLRGRAGRQGDPGSSQFYVSTEDDLMRIFGGDRMKNLMKTLNVPSDMPIENKMISKSIENAQRKVEGNNFDIRKHLVEYDDVISKHRLAIYRRRREILELSEAEDTQSQDKLGEIILTTIKKELESLVLFHTAAEKVADWNRLEIEESLKAIKEFGQEIKDLLHREDSLISDVGAYRQEILAFLDKVLADSYSRLKKSFEDNSLRFVDFEKGVMIRSIDSLWVEHLESIDYLRRGIGLQGYGQRDPLVEYKKEAYRMYQELNSSIDRQIANSFFKAGESLLAQSQALQLFAVKAEEKLEFSGALKEMQKEAAARNTFDLVHEKTKNEEGEKVGRNDLCPCGSGKKYKHCHGA